MQKKHPTEHLIDIALATQAINSANDGITISDMQQEDQPLIFVNNAFEEMTGYSLDEVKGKNCRFLQGNLKNQEERSILHEAIANKKNCRVVLKNFRKDGTLFWNELSLAPIIDSSGKLCYYVGIQKDISSEIVQKRKIIYLSEHDDLTNLYNYRGFFQKIINLISETIRQDAMIAIGIADIDFFKIINDKFGHLHGNTILQAFGAELLREFGSNIIIARFGGDEFCFAMLATDPNPDTFYEKISLATEKTNILFPLESAISVSSGIVFEQGTDNLRIDRLIHLADNIMYENKLRAHTNFLKDSELKNNE